jgi:hypothetical protein
LVLVPLDKRGQANMNVVEENFGYTLEGVFAYHLGLLEQWLQL